LSERKTEEKNERKKERKRERKKEKFFLVEEAKERFNHLLFIDLKKNFQEKRES
jgi:hypothetical protein